MKLLVISMCLVLKLFQQSHCSKIHLLLNQPVFRFLYDFAYIYVLLQIAVYAK